MLYRLWGRSVELSGVYTLLKFLGGLLPVPAALRERDFRRFSIGFLLSVTGSAMVPVAIAFTLYQQGGGPGLVAKVLAAETVPMVLLMLIGGAAGDRFSQRKVMIAADLLRLASQGTLAVLLIIGHPPVLVIMGLMALIGVGNAFYMPGRTGLVPQIVSSANLQSANACCAFAQSAGTILGPVVAGLLVAVAGGAFAILLDAISYGISAWLILTLLAYDHSVKSGVSIVAQLVKGWTEFKSRIWLWATVLQFATFHLFAVGPLIILGSLGFAHHAHGALGWGGLVSIQGFGAVLGALIANRWQPRRPIQAALVALLLYALIPAALAAGLPYSMLACAFFAGGFAIAMFNVFWDTTLQREIPPALLSCVSAYDLVGSICLLPLGYIIAAPMAALMGRDGALWWGTGFTVLSIIIVLCLPGVRRLRARPHYIFQAG